jgi:hypothetical protein
MRSEVSWAHIRPLPDVAPWNKRRRSRTWEHRRDEYAALPKEPIIVTAELATPVIHSERDWTHIDGLLSWAALTNHPVASHYDAAPVIPLPLELAWVSPDGLPLWACTPMMPAEVGTDSREYWHKRYPSHRAELSSRMSANTTGGRWREYRVPLRAHAVQRLHALAIGNTEEVERLLSIVIHIGKKGSMGYGRVVRWTVTTGTHALEDVLARRPVPVAYYNGRQPVGALELRRGWTPPYWYAPRWADCMVPEVFER